MSQATAPQSVSRRQLRLAQIDQLELDALAEPDPLKGCLAALNAGLLRLAVYFEENLTAAVVEMQTLAAEEPTDQALTARRQLERERASYLRLVRLIHSLSALDDRFMARPVNRPRGSAFDGNWDKDPSVLRRELFPGHADVESGVERPKVNVDTA